MTHKTCVECVHAHEFNVTPVSSWIRAVAAVEVQDAQRPRSWWDRFLGRPLPPSLPGGDAAIRMVEHEAWQRERAAVYINCREGPKQIIVSKGYRCGRFVDRTEGK